MDGSTPSREQHVLRVKFEGDRIRVPDQLVKAAQNSPLVGSDTLECWLLVIGPGRYRLITDSRERDGGVSISTIAEQIKATEAPGHLLDYTQGDAQAAILARLISCTVSPPPPGWRINVPIVARQLARGGTEATCVFAMVVAGFVEIWFPETLRQASAVPLSDVL